MSNLEKWENSWGDQYERGEKLFGFTSLFNRLFESGYLGENIVDVGCGMYPVTNYLPEGLDARVVAIDHVGGDLSYGEGRYKIEFDLDAIDNLEKVREAVSKVASFLNIESCDTKRHIDCFVFSDVLNYVDYKKVLRFFKEYLRAGGRFVIKEGLERGYSSRYSPNRYEGFVKLYELIMEEGFVIEQGPHVGSGFDDIIVVRLDV